MAVSSNIEPREYIVAYTNGDKEEFCRIYAVSTQEASVTFNNIVNVLSRFNPKIVRSDIYVTNVYANEV